MSTITNGINWAPDDFHHGELYARAIIPVYMELYKPLLTNFLVKYLSEIVDKQNYKRSPKEMFALLTNIDKPSKIQVEEQALLKIVLEINKNKKLENFFKEKSVKSIAKEFKKADSKFIRMIIGHIEKFRYLGYNFEGPAFPDEYFLRRIKEIIKRGDDIKEILRSAILERKKSAALISKIYKDLKIDGRYQKYFAITREIIYGKDYRKMSLVESYYKLEPLLQEIGRRAGLTLGEVRNCLINELEKMLNKNKKVKDLEKRMKGCLFIVLNKHLPGRIFVDDLYLRTKVHLSKKIDLTEINYFHGQTACPGKASGAVKIINTAKELLKMNKGDILVSQMTNPDIVPAMKKAAAIITDLGGITCHAAIVSRELKIPCIIGTKMATKVLRDGDKVFVDANQGEVRKI